MFINIHTHAVSNTSNVDIVNCFLQESNINYASYGIHPWYIDSINIKQQLQVLEHLLQAKNCLALGEVGLDKLCKIDSELQEKIFAAQIQLANTYNKPIIIHNVQSHNRILYLLKKHNNTMSVIFHGFNNNIHTAKQILASGAFLSLGKSLLNANSNASKILPQLPVNKIFFETDNDAAVNIEQVYAAAANILNITKQQLQNLIMQNFNSIFGNLL
jgi:TatD DNase family protein